MIAAWRRDRPHEEPRLSRRQTFYPGLDLLRGFAAVTVVVYHVIELFNWQAFPSSNALALWFRVGWMGVDLFFVISGFVIATSALNLLDRDPGRFRADFFRRRFSRIVPLHYLTCLTFTLFVMPALLFLTDFSVHALTHLTFTHNLFWYTQGSINGPNWSLGVEMQFYMLILIAAPLIRRVHPLSLLTVCLGVAWTWRAWVFAVHAGEVRNGLNMTWFGVSQVPGALDEFGLGIMLAMLLERDREGRLHRLLHASRYFWPVAAVAAGWLTMRWFWEHPAYWDDWKLVVFWKTPIGATFLLAIVSMCAINDRWFLRLTAPLRYLGTISYGIYLWHILVIMSLKPLLMGDPARACRWTLGLTLLLATLSWHLFEKPLLDRFSRRGTEPAKVGDRVSSTKLLGLIVGSAVRTSRSSAPTVRTADPTDSRMTRPDR
jgi:peptidoglycan/LPS O-acetylase OafA/YrhL